MAGGTFQVYGNAKLNVANGALALNNAHIAAVLVGTTYTPAVNTDSTYANISTYEVAAGNGYATGGTEIAGTTALASGTVTVSSTNPTWASSTITAKYCVLVSRATAGTTVSTDKLIGYVDLNTTSGTSTVSDTNGTFQVQWNASGIFTLA